MELSDPWLKQLLPKLEKVYDEHVAPMLMAFKQGFTEIGTLLLDCL